MFTQRPNTPHQRRVHLPLLAMLALALASLACISSELTLTVTHKEDGSDQVKADIAQYLTDSWVAAAEEVNQLRKADFAAAGKETDLEDLLPTSYEDVEESFDITRYQDQGYQVTVTGTGFTAARTSQLQGKVVTEDWQVQVISDPEHPEQITYRAKIWLDLTEMTGEDLLALRNQPQMEKPDLSPGAASSGGGEGSLGGMFSFLGDMTAEMERELSIEMYYVQLAMKQSDEMQYVFSVELPGTLLVHKLDGETRGEVEGNRVTLVLREADIVHFAGKKVTFLVESVLKDCSLACQEENQPHLIWDGEEEGISCNCVCEAGYEVIEGERACVNCDMVCPLSDPNLVTDLAACETNQCGCRCQDGYEINNAGTRCITTAEAEAEDNQPGADGGPSRTQIGEVVAGLLLGMENSEINQLPGWYLLTSGEREELLDLLETLGFAVDRTGLVISLGPEMSTDERIQRINEEKNRLQQIEQLAVDLAAEQIQDRRDIQEQIIKEIGGLSVLGQYLVKFPTYYQKLFETPKQLAVWVIKDQLTKETKKRILAETHGGGPESLQAAAMKLVEKIPNLATSGCVEDYYLYKQYFQEFCGGSCQGDDADLAHEQALEKLEAALRDSYYGTGRAGWAEAQGPYDRAFQALRSAGK